MQLLDKHKTVDSMVELLELYEEEDQAYGGLLEASTQLYQYLLQPFRDMRELAMLCRQQIKVTDGTSLLFRCTYIHEQELKRKKSLVRRSQRGVLIFCLVKLDS